MDLEHQRVVSICWGAINRAGLSLALAFSLGFAFGPSHLATAQTSADKFFAKVEQEALRDLGHKNPQKQLDAMTRLDAKHAAPLVPVLSALLTHADVNVRLAAAEQAWTQSQRDASAFAGLNAALRVALNDSSSAVAMNAAGALRTLGVKETELAPMRRRVLQSKQFDTYIGFLAARGLIGIDPPVSLFPQIFAYFVDASEAETRGGSDNNREIGLEALKDLVQTQDRSLIPMLIDEIDLSPTITPDLIKAINAFKPAPTNWVDVLLPLTDSPYEDIRESAWDALRDQRDPASIAKWMPVAARALARAERREDALYALSNVAGRSTIGLNELHALSNDSKASAEHRQTAIKTLGRAADKSNRDALAAVKIEAKSLWLKTCAPIFQTHAMDEDRKACRDGAVWVLEQDAERARWFGEWLQSNPHVEAKIDFLQGLESMWANAMPANAAVRAARAHPDARVVAAAEAALDRIEPAWRERDQRQGGRVVSSPTIDAVKTPSSSAIPQKSKAVSGRSGLGANGASLYGAMAQGNLAGVKKLVNAGNVNVPVRYPQMQGALPPPIQVAINYCGIPQAAKGLQSIIEYLLSIGADPDIAEADGSSLLDRAKYSCTPEIMAVLATP